MAVRIKEAIRRITPKQAAFFLTAVLSLLLYLGITLWIGAKLSELPDQNGAMRWDPEGGAAQVSCFLTENVLIDEFQIMGFEHELEQMLNEVLPEEEGPFQNMPEREEDKRLFIDAYSAVGTVSVSSQMGDLNDAAAIGVGGDFFLFHPLQLVSGSYFSGSDLMQDSIILDEDAAWLLFGSSDIMGMSVMIGGVPHYVSGVVKRPDGRMAEGAGLDKTVVFLSYDSLSKYGTGARISTYEVIAPNPVKNYLSTAVKEHLGVSQDDMAVVENSSRYSLENMIPVILDFGTRSMQNAAIRFPYWENIARGWEDVRGTLLVLQFILLLIPTVILTAFLVYKWRHRTFTARDIWNRLVDWKDKWRHF